MWGIDLNYANIAIAQNIIALKHLISFLIRYIPRKYLQLFSHWGLKVVAVFYRGKRVACPVCHHSFRSFLPYGRQARSNALCPHCLSLERHRMIWLFLQNETSFFEQPLQVLHIAPEACFIHRFEKLHAKGYLTADLESPLAKVKMDVHAIPFEDNRFDVVFCNHVLEHVADDRKAMSELYRVLVPGGFAILQIPLFYPLPETTFEDPSITTPAAREKAFGQSDHVRLYGKDYADRLRSAGFTVNEIKYAEQLPQAEVTKYALPLDEPVFYCIKPN